MSTDEELRNLFFAETSELMARLEQDILSLENNAAKELIDDIFRAVHSIKGSASFVGLLCISSFSHGVENILDLVRKGSLSIDSRLIDVLLRSLDVLKKMLASPEDENIQNDPDIQSVLAQMNDYLPDFNKQIYRNVNNADTVKNKEQYYKIKIKFNKDIFETGIDPLILIDELFTKGEMVECNINVSELPDIYKMDPFSLYISWSCVLKSNALRKEIEDIFIFVKDDSSISIEETGIEDIKSGDKKLGELLVEKGIIKDSDIEEALQKQSKIGEILIAQGKVTPAQLEKVVHEQQQVRKTCEASSIRVDTAKLDKLMNLVGELVINQARVAQISSKKEKIDILELSATAEALDRITRNIQEQIMRARMIPIESTFNQFQRMVRDLAKQKNKEIKLEVLGKETELDKTLIELINDPLKHMIRNSIDHGIEGAEERIAAGKSEIGTIVLNAYHEAGNIIIEVNDDGVGLDKGKILKKAREKGLISSDKELNDEEIYKLIFLPGFSTADEITEISGRGVGMDVVKNNINKLRGNVEISTVEGCGTTFRIILPLTLAIIDGMLVKVGEELYIIPLLSIVESIRPKEIDVKHVNTESEVINVRGEYIPLIRLYEMLGIQTDYKDPSKALIVIVSYGRNKVCLLVDNIIGQQQAVIKSLEENFTAIKGISGATILGDGSVAMILDIATIIKMVSNNKNN